MKSARVLLGLTLVIGLSGCAMKSDLPTNPHDRILLVKSHAQDAEMRAAELVPVDDRTDIKQADKGTLLSCSGGRQWSGNTTIQLKNPANGEQVVEQLGKVAHDHGFTVTRSTTPDGAARLRLIDGHGTSVYASTWVDGRSIEVNSFSECFPLPKDFRPERSY
ncbi:hypothetical protein ITJ54_04900 [Curtobacterium sp. VKM Ac-2865]|uniref:hypothetical protein n=1 Tax=Curtobacterium sp. VKM Ac-2865 TaxID=2783817 RepID=UPI00188CE62A|nr:hypothetical protein [Curtobacterium sp. VKM Ac-2865]MBF4582002.1 hypothetical protein [Curtobacterium sp. VKM Ac-2865]